MEKPSGDKFKGTVLLSEFAGACLLMLAYNLQGEDMTVTLLAYFVIVCSTYLVSGGHLNPSITVGVYISEKEYYHNVCYLLLIIAMQTFGCLLALGFGYILRVTVNVQGTDEKYLEPNVYA